MATTQVSRPRACRRDRPMQIVRERGNSAAAREMIADERDTLEGFHCVVPTCPFTGAAFCWSEGCRCTQQVWNRDADARVGHEAGNVADESNDRPAAPPATRHAAGSIRRRQPHAIAGKRAASSDRQGRHGDYRLQIGCASLQVSVNLGAVAICSTRDPRSQRTKRSSSAPSRASLSAGPYDPRSLVLGS